MFYSYLKIVFWNYIVTKETVLFESHKNSTTKVRKTDNNFYKKNQINWVKLNS